jgi:hypothetical protein
MESTLKEVIGTDSERALMDWLEANSRSAQAAVTTAATKTCLPCIFANYTG